MTRKEHVALADGDYTIVVEVSALDAELEELGLLAERASELPTGLLEDLLASLEESWTSEYLVRDPALGAGHRILRPHLSDRCLVLMAACRAGRLDLGVPLETGT